jgi:hypothetical protein
MKHILDFLLDFSFPIIEGVLNQIVSWKICNSNYHG